MSLQLTSFASSEESRQFIAAATRRWPVVWRAGTPRIPPPPRRRSATPRGTGTDREGGAVVRPPFRLPCRSASRHRHYIASDTGHVDAWAGRSFLRRLAAIGRGHGGSWARQLIRASGVQRRRAAAVAGSGVPARRGSPSPAFYAGVVPVSVAADCEGALLRSPTSTMVDAVLALVASLVMVTPADPL